MCHAEAVDQVVIQVLGTVVQLLGSFCSTKLDVRGKNPSNQLAATGCPPVLKGN